MEKVMTITAKRHNVLHDINAIFKISIDEESSTMVFQAVSRIYKIRRCLFNSFLSHHKGHIPAHTHCSIRNPDFLKGGSIN